MSMRNVLKAFAFFLLLCAAFTLAPISAFASALNSVASAPPSILGVPLTPATVLAFATSFFMPLVSALVSHPKWSATVEGYITLVLAAVSGFLTEWANSSDASHYDWKKAVVISGIALFTAVAGRLGLWKGTGLSAALSNFPATASAPPPPANG